VAEKYDPVVNWATHVDMKTGRPQVVSQYSTEQNGEDVNTTGICPAALGTKDQQPAAFSPRKSGCSTCRPTTSAWTTSRSV
jgi:glucose dehydrogenase